MDRRLLAAIFGPGRRLAVEAGLTDADLLARYADAADADAFAEVVRRHGPMVWAVCRATVADTADAEDAFQATFLAFVQSPRAVRRAASLPGFLHGVAVRVARKVNREAARRTRREGRAAVPDRDAAVPESAWDRAAAAVQAEIALLPASQRAVFLACDLGGATVADAARRLGWKPATVTGTLARARQRVRAGLIERGLPPFAAAVPGLVPWRLVEAVQVFPKAAGGAVPAALVVLATEGLTVGGSQLKLWAAAALVTGGLAVGVGPAVLPGAVGQGGGLPGTADAVPAKPAGDSAPKPTPAPPADAARPGWEYKCIAKPPEGDLVAVLAKQGQAGWEYAGPLTGEFHLSKNGDLAEKGNVVGQYVYRGEVLVFKRPAKAEGPARQVAAGTVVLPPGADAVGAAQKQLEAPRTNPAQAPSGDRRANEGPTPLTTDEVAALYRQIHNLKVAIATDGIDDVTWLVPLAPGVDKAKLLATLAPVAGEYGKRGGFVAQVMNSGELVISGDESGVKLAAELVKRFNKAGTPLAPVKP